MLKNYFLTAINNLIKNKLYSSINIAGLAIGLAACIIIALYVRDQYSYDKQWKDSDRIYRVNFSGNRPGKEPLKSALTPLEAMPLLEKYFHKEIEQSSRTFTSKVIIDTGIAQFEEKHVLVDPAFINMFEFDVLAGNLKTTLADPTKVALSIESATRYFGSEDPIGKVITINTGSFKADYKVTALYRIPGNTVLDVPLFSLLDDSKFPPSMKVWVIHNTGAYFQLKNGIDIEKLQPLTPAFLDQYFNVSQMLPDFKAQGSDLMTISFQNIKTIHLDSPWDTSRAGGSKTVVISFAAISVLVLIIGCINFIILTTAKATQRAREVAMRKVTGAKRIQLIEQFLGESIFIVLLALIMSLGIVEIMMPVFESIVGKSLSPDYSSPSIYLSLISMLLIVGISGGLYPAFYLSGFRPGSILMSNQAKETKGSISMRGLLIAFQFGISIVLMIAASVIYLQINYNINRDPGFNKDNLVVINKIDRHPELRSRVRTLKEELLKLTSVSSVGLSDTQPSQKNENCYAYTNKEQPGNSYVIAKMGVDYDYFTTYQIPVVTGRYYNAEQDKPEPIVGLNSSKIDTSPGKINERNIIINERAARELGFSGAEEAVGKIINSVNERGNTDFTIIGVVADNHIFSINALPRSEVYLLEPDQASVITARFKDSPQKIIKEVNEVWKKVMGDAEISLVFVDQLVAREFKQEKTEQKILISFSILAIFIACIGLFASTAFTIERRTMEIGLRKVMGARVKNIVSLLIWQFSKPVLIANIIAWPVAILVMQNWLERFPYRINLLLLIPICIVSGLIALVIAWSTVAGNTTRVAKSRPVKALRYE